MKRCFSAKCFVFICCLLCCVIAYGQQELNAEVEAVMKRALAAYRQSDFETAKQELQRAQVIRRDWPEVYLLKALITRKEGDRDAAIKLTEKAIRLRSTYPTAHYLLAQLLVESLKLNDAHKEVSLAIAQGLKDANTYVLLSHIELMRRRAKEALVAFEIAAQQPAPKNELTDALRLRMEAVRCSLEFFAREPGSHYQRPFLVQESLQVAKRYPNVGTIDLAGVVNEHGKFEDVVLLGAEAGANSSLELSIAKQHIQFRPAKKDGKPVSFWVYFSYKRDSVIVVMDKDKW